MKTDTHPGREPAGNDRGGLARISDRHGRRNRVMRAGAAAWAVALLAAWMARDGWTATIPWSPTNAPWAPVAGVMGLAPEEDAAGVWTVESVSAVLHSAERLNGPHRIHATVRLRTQDAPAASAVFTVGAVDAAGTGFTLRLSVTRGIERIQASVQQGRQALHDIAALSKDLNWASPFANNFIFRLRAYEQILPGWPEEYRARIEQDMAQLPGHDEKWLDVRVELRPGEAAFWLDDRLVGIKRDAAIEAGGFARVELSQGCQITSCAIEPMVESGHGFLPLRLGGYANARELLPEASVDAECLSLAGERVEVGGVPFVFGGVGPEGHDHIDIGRSLFRQANSQEYLCAFGPWWQGSAYRDPARIQLRIPNGQYDSLYLLAAADGETDSIPLVTAMFYRPNAGFSEQFSARVPLATSRRAEVKPFPVRLSGGQQAKLWLVRIPLDPGRLSSFADLDIVEVELTKAVHQYRYYPDPAVYGWHQGGPPSGVHIYAATLADVPVGFAFEPDRFAHVWTAPETPSYNVRVTNFTDVPQKGLVTVRTRSYDGIETTRQKLAVRLENREQACLSISVPVERNGYHEISAALAIAGRSRTEERSFVRLAPDTRSATWTEGRGALFGFWDYGTAHHGPKAHLNAELMTRAGARTATSYAMVPALGLATNALVAEHWGRIAGQYHGSPQEWAKADPYDPAAYTAYQTQAVTALRDWYETIPGRYRPDFSAIFGESHISLRMTCGNYPEYWGEPDYEPTAEETERIRMHYVTAQCIAEGIRRGIPGTKILIEWGDPLFVIPLLKAGFPTNLIDGTALDNANFERLPEQQLHQVSLHRLYELKTEFAKVGIENPALYYIEGPFMPTEVGALSWREQMDIQDRFALISMAYGVNRFYSGWFTFDCASWVGAEHYGGCGVFRRIPYCNPKPAFAAYATMTEQLNEANFDGRLHTGSLTTYCLRFNGPRGNIYALWTLRGRRPVTLTLAADAEGVVTDAMNNSHAIRSRGRTVTVMTDPSVLYVSGTGEILSVSAGAPDHSDARPAKGARKVADLGDGAWRYTSQPDPTYEENDFDTFRYPGRFRSAITKDRTHGKVLVSTLQKQGKTRELMPWYNTLTPAEPIVLKGAPSHLGLWVRASSDWGRVVYCLRDAKGERWISVGTKDQWNCDDLHSWSAFNFDGWRYLRFEVPGHTGYDSYRKHGTSWWGSHDGDGVVDLPLSLESLIVEQRTHILYVNDVQPVATNTVCFGKLYAEYADPADATDEAVRISRLRMPPPDEAPGLPNPIREMTQAGVAPPVTITALRPPDWNADGTRAHVTFTEAPGAKGYYVWASPHADGRGAVNLTPAGVQSGALVQGLRPAVPFTFWVTYLDETGKMSKPSPAFAQTLVDMFKEK